MDRYIVVLACVWMLSILVSLISLEARDYITQSQLEESTIVDLPAIGGITLESVAENMTANAISRVSNLLSNYTG